MWQPEPGWQRLPGAGPATHGVWVAQEQGREVVIKRLLRPDAHDEESVRSPAGLAYWRRAADVALSRVVAETPGVCEAPLVRVEEDDAGVTLVHARVEGPEPTGLWLASCLGRFAGAQVPDAPWLARGQLGSRLAQVARRGGWTSLARTPAADVAAHLWERRTLWLERCDALPQVLHHGDATPANFPGRHGDDAVAIDWSQLGIGPVGADLGYLSLTAREEFTHLVDAHVAALPAHTASRDQVLMGARVTAVFTSLTRVDWALSRVAEGDGALAGKFRHPSVAPYIRAMQRQVDQIEALLG